MIHDLPPTNNSDGKNISHALFSSVESTTKYRLFLSDLSSLDGPEWFTILNILHSSQEGDTLETRINSSGGYVRVGQQLINVMRDKFPGKSITVLEADAMSMAASVFAAGDNRIIYPHSTLMVHDYSVGTYGKGNEIERQILSRKRSIKEHFTELFKDFLSKREIKDVFSGKDIWMHATELCERGLATHIICDNKMITASEYLEGLKDGKNSDNR